MAKSKEVKTLDSTTEEKIKEAARVVFYKKGYAATRTRDIAEEAGINLPRSSRDLMRMAKQRVRRDDLEPGDILLSVNGKPVKDPQTLLDLIAGQSPGDTVPFKLRRQKSMLEATLRIGKRPALRGQP